MTIAVLDNVTLEMFRGDNALAKSDAALLQKLRDIITKENEIVGAANILATAASSLDGRATSLEGRATTLEGRATALENSSAKRILMSGLTKGTTGFLLVADTAYFVYLGQTVVAMTPKYVEFYMSVAGVGTQAAEVGFFSTPLAPNKASQVLTKIIASGTLGDLTGAAGMKRNTSAFTTAIPVGTHLWAGIRTAMATDQPTITGLLCDHAQGHILATSTAGVLTGAGPWTGAIVTAALTENCPDLRGTLD